MSRRTQTNFLAKNSNFGRCINAEPHYRTADQRHGNHDIVTDVNAFAMMTGQDQHDILIEVAARKG